VLLVVGGRTGRFGICGPPRQILLIP
jgi:hypothetical protein